MPPRNSLALLVIAAAMAVAVPLLSARYLEPLLEPDRHPALSAFFAEARTLMAGHVPDDEIIRFEQLFAAVFERIMDDHVDEPDPSILIDGAAAGIGALDAAADGEIVETLTAKAIGGMINALGDDSRYLSAEVMEEMRIHASGEVVGIGSEVSKEGGSIRLQRVFADSPAQLAGLRDDDAIVAIDGESVADMSLQEAVNRLRGTPGSVVGVTVSRNGQETLIRTIKRGAVRIPAIRAELHGSVTYFGVGTLAGGVATELRTSLEAFLDRPGERLSGAVLDLRRSPGGLLSEAVAVTDIFLDEGAIVEIYQRSAVTSQSYVAEPGDLINGLPLAVLVDGETKGTSHVIAEALQINGGRATIMGTHSPGNVVVNTIIPFSGGDGMRLTVGRYFFSPSGQALDRLGIVPDIALVDGDASVRARRSSVDHNRCPYTTGDKSLDCALGLVEAGGSDPFLASLRR